MVTTDWLDPDVSETITIDQEKGAVLIEKTLEKEPKISFVDELLVVNLASVGTGKVTI